MDGRGNPIFIREGGREREGAGFGGGEIPYHLQVGPQFLRGSQLHVLRGSGHHRYQGMATGRPTQFVHVCPHAPSPDGADTEGGEGSQGERLVPG